MSAPLFTPSPFCCRWLIPLIQGKKKLGDDVFAGFADLREGCDVAVKAMVCRKWDAHNSFEKYLSTEFILSDPQGQSIQCSARSNISHRFVSKMIEGNVYIIKKFSVIPNRERYSIRRTDEHMIALEGYTMVRKIACPDDGFERYPFELMPLEDVDLNDSVFLIDVIGWVVDIGKIRTSTGGSDLLDFEIMNERGTRVRVTLWAPLCSDLLKRKGGAVDPYVVILPAMNVKEFRGDLFLSSTSATVLFDAPEIPQIATLAGILRENGAFPSAGKPVAPLVMNGSIYQLLPTGREQHGTRKKRVTFHCKGTMQSIQTKDGWFYFACGLGGCKKRVSRSGTKFMCQTCSKVCEFPRTSYRLHLTIADPTGTVVVTLFDEVATKLLGKTAAQLLSESEDDDADSVIPPTILALTDTRLTFEIKTSSYYDQGTYESFTVVNVMNPSVDKLLPLKRPHAEMDDIVVSAATEHVANQQADGHYIDASSSTLNSDHGSDTGGDELENKE